ncbi:MAG: hypothetical protein ACP5G1_04700, partial [Nanopusillaceae archaeon]
NYYYEASKRIAKLQAQLDECKEQSSKLIEELKEENKLSKHHIHYLEEQLQQEKAKQSDINELAKLISRDITGNIMLIIAGLVVLEVLIVWFVKA